jgi:hypothetical protein
MANFLEYGSLPNISDTRFAKSQLWGTLHIIFPRGAEDSRNMFGEKIARLAVKALARIKIKSGKCSQHYPFWKPLTPYYCGHIIEITHQPATVP